MIKVDAIRHYISANSKIVEGFLGQQNPQLDFINREGNLRMSVHGKLKTVQMYRPGQFGIDIYLPLSTLTDLCTEISAAGIKPLFSNNMVKFDPQGTEQGPKRVPNVVVSMGRITYTRSITVVEGGQKYCTEEGGYAYVDVETHNEENHKTWTLNPVMEPFELHLGLRGKQKRHDPFEECHFSVPPDIQHITEFSDHEARRLLGILLTLQSATEYHYTATNSNSNEWDFSFTHGRDIYTIRKPFTQTN